MDFENKLTFKIGEDINFSYINCKKFKTSHISVTFFLPLEEDLASGLSLLIATISDSCEKFESFESFNKYLEESYGIHVDYDVNKVGNYHVLSLYAHVLDDRFVPENSQNIFKASDLLCELIFRPKIQDCEFVNSTILRHKRQLIELIEAQIADKRIWSLLKCEKNMCKNEKCGIHKYGEISRIEKINGKDLFDLYKFVLKKSKIEIMLIANSSYEEIIKKFERNFSEIERDVEFEFKKIDAIIPKNINQIVEKMDVQQCKLVMGFRTPFIEPSNTVPMNVTSAILGGLPTSRLFLNVREKLNLCYYCSIKFNKSTGIVFIESGIEEDKLEQVKSEILNQIDILKNGNLTIEEIDEVKKYLIQKTKMITDKIRYINDWFIFQIPFGVIRYPHHFIDEISKISKEDIVYCASKIVLDTVFILTKET